MCRCIWIAALFGASTVSFVAGGYFWDSILFSFNRYCIFGISVTDGDTIACEGRLIRLKGFDSPEKRMISSSSCKETAKKAGLAATCMLERLVSKGGYEVIPTYERDDHQRPVAHLIIGGRNAGLLLEAHGLAGFYETKADKPDWCELLTNSPGHYEAYCYEDEPNHD